MAPGGTGTAGGMDDTEPPGLVDGPDPLEGAVELDGGVEVVTGAALEGGGLPDGVVLLEGFVRELDDGAVPVLVAMVDAPASYFG